MKPLSETYKELGIAFRFPIEIRDANGKATYFENSDNYWGNYWKKWEYDTKGRKTYCENSDGDWSKWEYDANGCQTYYEFSDDYWYRYEYDAKGKETYFENSDGVKRGTPKSTNQ